MWRRGVHLQQPRSALFSSSVLQASYPLFALDRCGVEEDHHQVVVRQSTMLHRNNNIAFMANCTSGRFANTITSTAAIAQQSSSLLSQMRSFCSSTSPRLQGMPLVKQSQDPESMLLSKAGYALFIATTFDTFVSVYCATTHRVFVCRPDQVQECAEFIAKNTDTSRFAASIVFPATSDQSLASFVTSLKDKVSKSPEKRILIIGPDVWSVVYSAFRLQQEHVRTMQLPSGFEDASVLMSNKCFEPLNVPAVETASGIDKQSEPVFGKDSAVATLMDHNSAVRRALVVWDTMVNVHKRFGVQGGKKTMNPIELIVRRAVKAVNIFGIDLDNRLAKGSVTEGITMVATVYNAQTGTNSVHQLRNLAEDQIKQNVLTTLFFGEGMSSITLFYPSPRTKETQLTAFARMCKPKCPFFIAQLSQCAPFFKTNATAYHFPEVNDPKTLFQRTIAASFPGAARKDENENGKKIINTLTYLAQRMFDERVAATASVFSAGYGKIPPAADAAADYQKARQATAATASPTATSSTFLNRVAADGDVVACLEDWLWKIYSNPERLEREKACLNTLSRYLIVDLETTTAKRYKRIANPFTKENHVVLSGAMDYQGTVFMPKEYFSRDVAQNYDDPKVCAANTLVEGASKRSLFLPPLDGYDVIVGHNLKFDLLHLWRDAEVKAFLKRGGRIWDTMYGEYLLTGHQIKLGRGAGLEDVAKSYGGQTPKLDLVKQAWAEGKQTYEIPYATLREYLMGDLKNTELIFLKHRERALNQRQVIICNERMDSLLATTEMEYNGLKTDVALAVKQSNQLVADSTAMRLKLEASIPQSIPAKLRRYFNWASNQMLITVFFGGKLKITTGNRSSKALTGEKVARHLAFAAETDYPTEVYPQGVFLSSIQNSSAPGDCVAVTTCGEAEKGTRLFVTCVEFYMKQAGFRKSSTLADGLSKAMLAVPRTLDSAQLLAIAEAPDTAAAAAAATPDSIINLLPDRVIFLYAALEMGKDMESGSLKRLVLRNAVSGEVKEFLVSGNSSSFADDLEAFLKSQVVAHTKALIKPSDADPSMSPEAFVDAQVVLIARDAPFSFRKNLEGQSAALKDWLERRSQPSTGTLATTPLAERFSVSLADATSTVLFYRSDYGTDETVILPEFSLPVPKKTKAAGAMPAIQKEIEEDPTVWCERYSNMLRHIADRVLVLEGELPLEKKKARKNAPPPRADESMPLLLRRRPFVLQAYRAMPPSRAQTLALMMLFGRAVGTPHDAFVEPSPFDEVVEVPMRGKLIECGVPENQAESIMKKFRSPTTRQLQVGDETLAYFAKTHKDPVANLIMDLRGMEKLIGTYYEHTEGGTGMVSLVNRVDSCIHHELIHNKTNTGRLASANPNCQNIPKEDKSPLREMFVSRFAPHGKCIEVDYSQLEVITLAALSKDKQMIEDLINNVDFHCKRVTMIRPDLSYEDVVQRAKKNKEPEYVKLRQQAKIFSFQRQYGAGVAMLSASTGLSPDQIRLLIDKERQVYKGCDNFTSIVTLSANNYDPSIQDGSRNIRGHQLFKGMFPVITGSRYVFTESDVPESIMKDKPSSTKSTNFSPTHIKNYPVQGFAGEIVQIMLGKLWRHFVANENYGGKALLTNTVHDCVWVDTTDDVYLQVSKDVERILSSAKEELNRLWPEMECDVRFGVDVVAGENMCHLRPLPKQ